MNIIMKKHKLRKTISVNFIILTLILLCCCTKLPYSGAAQVKATGEFSVTALNIGKADSLILKTQNHTVLTDCGEKGDSDDIINALAESGVSEIDCLIITHFDKDKEKLRLRSYGVPNTDTKVFLEIKKKYNGIVNKRRTVMTLDEAYEFTRTGKPPVLKEYMNEQVINEIAYFLFLCDNGGDRN